MRHPVGRVTSVLLLSLALAQNARAAPACSNRDFNGTYSTIARGTLFFLPPVFAPLIGPVMKVALTFADGNGHVSEITYASYNGVVFPEARYFGTYSVKPDCTIVLNWMDLLPIIVGGTVVQFSPLIPIQFTGALADGGADVLVGISAVQSGPPGAVIRVHMRRQDGDSGRDDDQNPACSERTLRGGYQVDMYGDVTDTSRYPWPPLPVFAFARQGTLSFDGQGRFSGDTTASYGGLQVAQETLNGTYSVDSSCNVALRSTTTTPFTWRGAITDGGKGAVLLVTSPQGAVIGGTLLRQGTRHD